VLYSGSPPINPDQQGSLELLIKTYPKGPMSSHIHSLNVGETLEFKGPIPKYPMTPNKHEHIAMIAGGTGITPMYQVIRYIFSNPNEKTKVTLIFGNITKEDILLSRELSRLENEHPSRLKIFYTLDDPPHSWQQETGFITKKLLQKVLPSPEEGEKIKIFVCGPPGMYKAISGGKKSPADQGELTGYLKELGYSKDQVYKF
jgi:cytochrome-b5 reductase